MLVHAIASSFSCVLLSTIDFFRVVCLDVSFQYELWNGSDWQRSSATVRSELLYKHNHVSPPLAQLRVIERNHLNSVGLLESIYRPQSSLNKPFCVDLLINRAGTFSYYLSSSSSSGSPATSDIGYFSIDPVLSIPSRSSILSCSSSAAGPTRILSSEEGGATILSDTPVNLPLNGLVIQTVIAKWMGTVSNWESQGHLALMSRRGYNMLHYTPLQVRGESDSPYSIRDQLDFDLSLFDPRPGISSSNVSANVESSNGNSDCIREWTREEKYGMMRDALRIIKEKHGMLGMIDVVLNHTANDSEWLADHPEAGK